MPQQFLLLLAISFEFSQAKKPPEISFRLKCKCKSIVSQIERETFEIPLGEEQEWM